MPDAAATAAGSSLEKLFAAERLLKVGGSLSEDDPAPRRLRRLLMLLAANNARAVMTAEPRGQGAAKLLAQASAGSLQVSGWRDHVRITARGDARIRPGEIFSNAHVRRAPSDFESWLMLFGIASALGDPDAVWEPAVRLTQMAAVNVAQHESSARSARSCAERQRFGRRMRPCDRRSTAPRC